MASTTSALLRAALCACWSWTAFTAVGCTPDIEGATRAVDSWQPSDRPRGGQPWGAGSSLAVAVAPGNDVPWLAVGTSREEQGRLTWLGGDLTVQQHVTGTPGSSFQAILGPSVADLDGNGVPELLVSGVRYNVPSAPIVLDDPDVRASSEAVDPRDAVDVDGDDQPDALALLEDRWCVLPGPLPFGVPILCDSRRSMLWHVPAGVASMGEGVLEVRRQGTVPLVLALPTGTTVDTEDAARPVRTPGGTGHLVTRRVAGVPMPALFHPNGSWTTWTRSPAGVDLFPGTVGDFDGDGIDDIAFRVEARDDLRDSIAVFRGPFAPGELTVTDTDAIWYADATRSDGFGTAMTAGDFDGDGADELFVGAPEQRNGRGRVYRIGNPFELGEAVPAP